MVFLYYVRKKNKQNYLKRLETDVEFAILFIASEIIGASEIISIFSWTDFVALRRAQATVGPRPEAGRASAGYA